MTTHTPGPWTVYQGKGLGTIPRIIVTTGGLSVADANAGYPCAESEQDANARLIAAAPDLFAALKAAEVMLRGCRVFVPKTDVLDATHADVLNAIAKAEGGAA